jgi:hypothetical protein
MFKKVRLVAAASTTCPDQPGSQADGDGDEQDHRLLDDTAACIRSPSANNEHGEGNNKKNQAEIDRR